ncbi:aminotransferase class V-fold PLP-dependent enzyme [soil metagenome]
MPPLPTPSPLSAHWNLDKNICFLNHGSFGATPRHITGLQRTFHTQMEADPVRWFVETLEPLLDAARTRIAALVNADPEDLAFIPNATTGVATVLANLRLNPGDELLTSDHEYNACSNILRAAALRAGATITTAKIPFPITTPEAAERAILAAVTPRTRLALISHITSPTALILPVARLVAALRAQSVLTLIDGAHAPAFLPIDLRALNADFYTGNLHKWLSAPKGAAFLHIRRDLQTNFNPLVISHGFNSPRTDRSRFRLQFDFTGTQDMSPYLCAAACPDHLSSLLETSSPAADPLTNFRAANNDLCRRARTLIAAALGVDLPAPASMLGAMATIPLPPHPRPLALRLAARPTKYQDALQDTLLTRHRIQVPIINLPALTEGDPPRRFVRIACMLYNAPAQYEYLAGALTTELASERDHSAA